MKRTSFKRYGQRCAITFIVLFLGLQAGCLASQRFRDAAGPALQSGITDIVNGLLDGFFAVIDPPP